MILQYNIITKQKKIIQHSKGELDLCINHMISYNAPHQIKIDLNQQCISPIWTTEQRVCINWIISFSLKLRNHEWWYLSDRIANILILSFHKQREINGSVEITNKAIQYMTIKVLKMAPYFDVILVDRGKNNRVK